MALTRLPSFTLLTTDDFTFGNVTVSGNITANYLIGNGSQLTGLPASYTDTNANAAIDAKVTKAFIDNLNVDADTLDGLNSTAFATSAQGTLADSAVQPGDLATVATTGSYTDLINKPTLFDGTYANLTGLPTLGTAAATNANAYATAAQGTKADTALQSADLVGYATETYVGTQISNLVDAAPTTLNTLNELAAALGDDANFATTIANSIGNKLAISDFTSTADTWLGTKTTSNVSEGTNLYFTDTRANSAIDTRVTKTFVDNLSVVANISNIAYSITGSNVSGPVAFATTANSVAGANVSGEVAFAAVANSVSAANVSGLGNVATLNLDGNVSNILYGNGVFAAAPAGGGGSSYGDSNIAAYLPTYTGNLTPGNLIIDPTNLKLSGGSADYVLTTDGTGNLSWAAQSGGGGTVNSSYVTRTYTGNGSTTGFTVTSGVTVDSVIVSLSGIVQTPTTDYSVTGTTLTFTTAPPNGVQIQIREIGIPMASGSNSQILFNDAGKVGGTANLTFNKSTGMLTAAKLTATSANLGDVGNLRIAGGNVGEILASLGNGQMAWANIVANGDIIVNGGTGGGGASVTVSATAPTTPAEGDMWLDSETGELNVYFSDAWASVTESAPQLTSVVDNFTGDSLTTQFTLSATPTSEAYTLVAIGGILQPRNTYSISGNVLTTSSAVPSNTPIEVTTLGGFASPVGAASVVLNNAQPNITSVGTLTGLDIAGNVSVTGNLTINNAAPATTGKAIAMAIVFGF